MRKPIAVLLAVLLAWLAVGCHADDNRDQEREFLSLEEERSSEETEIDLCCFDARACEPRGDRVF